MAVTNATPKKRQRSPGGLAEAPSDHETKRSRQQADNRASLEISGRASDKDSGGLTEKGSGDEEDAELPQLGEGISALTIDITNDDFDSDTWVCVQQAPFGTAEVVIGSDLEFPDQKFCRVTQILRGKETGLHRVRGFSFLPLSRNSALLGLADNEVYWDLKSFKNGAGRGLREHVEYELHDAVRKRKIVATNLLRDFHPGGTINEDDTNVRCIGVLRCERKLVQEFETAKSPKASSNMCDRLQPHELRHLGSAPDDIVPESNLRRSWRDVIGGPGSADTICVEDRVRSLSLGDALPMADVEQQYLWEAMQGPPKYTFGDIFCCSGGASSAALLAGLLPVIALDVDPVAMASHRVAFDEGILRLRMPVDEFISHHGRDYQIDILHTSPPCQVFAKCHTTPGKNDDANYATSYSLTGILEKTKPRIVIMENTSGLSSDHCVDMHSILSQFIRCNYSIRWAVLNAADYGVPQVRKRLILIGTAIGEVPMHLPSPTHAKAGTAALPAWRTIRDALQGIPPDALNHAPQLNPKGNWPKKRRNWDTQARTITTSGGDNYHPDGWRPYTLRELARLQTFPDNHGFAEHFQGKPVSATEIKRQIGNAVSPAMLAHIYRQAARHLAATDEA